jgi:putative mRNA 3-end processing factor
MLNQDTPILSIRPEGLYCPAGRFYIDPWRSVEQALITHAHADHARSGNQRYLAAAAGEKVLRKRLGTVNLQTLPYCERLRIGDVDVSFHPAGHVLGSAQIRLEYRGEVWVVSGDYKLDDDATCTPFEPVTCHTFVSESTFGLPIYRWSRPQQIFDEINRWWQGNAREGRASILYGYSFGKAQRILSGVDASIGPIFCHGAIELLNEAYRETGLTLPQTGKLGSPADRSDPKPFGQALILAPPSAAGSPWIRRFGDASDAFASGWMQLRGARRRRAVDRGFVLSDHADWPSLQRAIGATGAQRVLLTHGYVAVMVRWLREQGLEAQALETEFGSDDDEPSSPVVDLPHSDVSSRDAQ